MSKEEVGFDEEVYRFLMDLVDTVPQMEALLLLWETRPRRWAADELAARLYVGSEAVPAIMNPLIRRKLVASAGGGAPAYACQAASAEDERLLDAVCDAYRKNLVRATTLIHTKASRSVREFARAFQWRKRES